MLFKNKSIKTITTMLKKFFYLSFVVLSFSACNFRTGGIANSDFTFNLRSVGETFAPSDSNFFYVDIDVDAYGTSGEAPIYDINTVEEYGTSVERNSPSNCQIEYIPTPGDGDLIVEKDSSETLLCILDIPEEEFSVKDFHLVFNIPEGMCDKLERKLPWHFNYQLQPGPLVVECKRRGDGDDSSGGESGFCNNRANVDDNCNDGCNARFENCSPNICITEEENLCPGNPKCCYKGSKSDGSEWEPDQECFGGPGPVVDGAEFQEAVDGLVPEGGYRETITVPSLQSINEQHNRKIGGPKRCGYDPQYYMATSSPYANYHKVLDKSVENLKTISTNDLPNFLQPEGNYNPNLFFEFSCKDVSGEILHQILFMVREWNTLDEFMEFYNSGGAYEGNPDITGEENVDCNYDDRYISRDRGEPCNDMRDFNDIDDSETKKPCYPEIPYSNTQGEDEPPSSNDN